MLSAVTLRDLITAHAALDTLEMEHHAEVYTSFVYYYKKKANKVPDARLDIHARDFWEREICILRRLGVSLLISWVTLIHYSLTFSKKYLLEFSMRCFVFLGFRKSLLRDLTSSFITGLKP